MVTSATDLYTPVPPNPPPLQGMDPREREKWERREGGWTSQFFSGCTPDDEGFFPKS